MADSRSTKAMIFYMSQAIIRSRWIAEWGKKLGADFIFKRIHVKEHRVGYVGNTLSKQAV